MDTVGRSISDGFLCVGVSMHVDTCSCKARDKLLALAAFYGGLHACAGLRWIVCHFSGWKIVGVQLMFDWQAIMTAMAVLGAGSFIGAKAWRRVRSLRTRSTAGCISDCQGCGIEVMKRPTACSSAIGFGARNLKKQLTRHDAKS